MYKYGIPDGVDPVELRAKLDRISREWDEKCKDPEFVMKLERNAMIAGRISAKDLDKQFTI